MTKMQKKFTPVLAKVEGNVSWLFADSFVENINAKGESKRSYLDGVGIINGVLYANGDESSLEKEVFKGLTPRSIKGALTLYLSEEDKYQIISDYIGSSFIYFYKDNGLELYSSSLKSLLNALSKFNIYPKKSLAFQACNNTFGNGNFGLSSYENVFILPENTMVIATSREIKRVSFSIDADLLDKRLSYKECLLLAKEDLIVNAQAILNSAYPTKLAHLTGGFDSRLVVSIFDYLNRLEDIELNCLGVKGSIDYDNAYRVAAELNAKFSNRANYKVNTHPIDLEQKYIWEIETTQGMISNNPLHSGLSFNNEMLIMSGGYGELLRAFYKVDTTQLTTKEAANYLGKFFNKEGRVNSLLKEDTLLELHDKVLLFIEEAKLKGFSLLQAMQLFYIKTRNRYYLGNLTKLSSKFTNRFDPLYSPYVFQLGFLVSDDNIKLGKPLFDLMNLFSQRLALMPFGTSEWNEHLLQEKELKVTGFNHDLNPMMIEFPVIHTNSWMPKVSSESRVKAREMKAAVWQVETYPLIQKSCLEILEEHGNDFFQYYDRTQVMRLLNNVLNHRGVIRSVFQLYGCLIALYR